MSVGELRRIRKRMNHRILEAGNLETTGISGIIPDPGALQNAVPGRDHGPYTGQEGLQKFLFRLYWIGL
jgi:hypothetical protein